MFIFGHKFVSAPWHHHWSNMVTFSHLTLLQRVKMLDSANCSSNGYVLPDKLNIESLFWKPLSPMPQLLHGLPFLFWCLYNFLVLTAPSSFLVASASNRQAILEQKILRELFKHFGSIFSFSLLSKAHVNQTFVLLTAQKSVFSRVPWIIPEQKGLVNLGTIPAFYLI